MEALREEIYDYTSDPAQESFRNQQYQRSSMQRSAIVDRLRREGCRITKQRKIILDIILQEECTCCKEIYFLASKKDPNIGMATVYRMINLLEEIGALKRKSAYRICDEQGQVPVCCVQLDDQTNIRLDNENFARSLKKEWNPADIFSQGEYDAYPLKIATNGLPEENTQKTEVNYSVFR